MMHGPIRTLAGLLALAAATIPVVAGCRGTTARTGAAATSEPALTADIDPGVSVVENNPSTGASTVSSANPGTAKTVSVVDRHPLLRKPKQYYDSTNSNKAVKTAAAAVVGVPAGIVGELRQIVVGRPSGEVTTTTATGPR